MIKKNRNQNPFVFGLDHTDHSWIGQSYVLKRSSANRGLKMEHFLSQGTKMPSNYIKSVSQETNVKNELFEYHQNMNYPEETLESKF